MMDFKKGKQCFSGFCAFEHGQIYQICPESSLVLKRMKFENVEFCSVTGIKTLFFVFSHHEHTLLSLPIQYAQY